MPKEFFLKEIANNPFIVDGKAVQFEVFPGNTGLLELESGKSELQDKLIAALNEAAGKHRGGIVKLTEPQFSEKKSQLLSTPLPRQRAKDVLRAAPRGPFLKKSDTAAPAAAPVSAPLAVPRAIPVTRAAEKAIGASKAPSLPAEGFRPPVRRIRRDANPEPSEAPAQ